MSAPSTIISSVPFFSRLKWTAGGHGLLGARPRSFQVTPDIPDRRRATQQKEVRPAGPTASKRVSSPPVGTFSSAPDITDAGITTASLMAKARGSRSRGSGSSHAPTSCVCSGCSGPAQWRVRGHRSEHLADITWDAHVRASAGAEWRKRIRLRHAGVVHRSSLRARPVGGGSPLSARRSTGGCPRRRSRT